MICILSATLRTQTLQTRLPFRYGIVTAHAFEHAFVRVVALVDGVEVAGVAADSLAPKWFSKNPATSIEQDVAEMKQVVAAACAIAENAGEAETVFALWRRVYDQMHATGGKPALLLSFGASLIERALIDAFCRAACMTFAHAVRSNALGIQLDAIHPELRGRAPADLLPALPLRRIIARHTVGLIDPLTDADARGQHDDGLPHSLAQNIREYGLTHFKIKLSGDAAQDCARLAAVAGVITQHCREYAFTLDGNENYRTVDAFRDAWGAISSAPMPGDFLRHMMFVEQPLHRDVALSDSTGEALRDWRGRPALIIDESDGELDSLRVALRCGYAGASHKNCKGVFKGIANACFAAITSLTPNPSPSGRGETVISGEDLCNVGPVALLQDLAVMAMLGIAHVERNGHHYFCGLSMFSPDLQTRMIEAHGDVYRRHTLGFATLHLHDGCIDAGSVVDAPFGYAGSVRPMSLIAEEANT
jgi:hypothetical protein